MFWIKDKDINTLFKIGSGVIAAVLVLCYIAAMDSGFFKENSDKNYLAEKINQLEASIPDNLIDINTADEWQLQILPSIGEVKAKAIVTYRQRNGEFKEINDLLKVKGISIRNLDLIRDKIILKGQIQ